MEKFFLIITGYVNLLLHSLGIRKKEIYTERYKICQKCSKRKGIICGICGCFISAKVCNDYPISEIDKKSIGGCPLNPPLW